MRMNDICIYVYTYIHTNKLTNSCVILKNKGESMYRKYVYIHTLCI